MVCSLNTRLWCIGGESIFVIWYWMLVSFNVSGIFPLKILWCTLPSKVMSLYLGINVALRPRQRCSLVQCIMVNSEALNWSNCREEMSTEHSATNGTSLSHPGKPRLRGHCRRRCKKIVGVRGLGGWEWISDFWVWLVLPVQGQGGLQPPVEWRTVLDSWWLPGRGESVLSKDVAPGRSVKSQWMSPHLWVYRQHTLDLSYKKRNKKKQGEDVKLGWSQGWILVG